jgi:hypothetical protein
MRYADIALALIPIALLIAWAAGVRGLSPRGIVIALTLLACIGASLVWMGHERGFTGRYQPARLDDGRVVPGHPG